MLKVFAYLTVWTFKLRFFAIKMIYTEHFSNLFQFFDILHNKFKIMSFFKC